MACACFFGSIAPPQILPGKVPHAVGRQGGLSANWLGKHVKNSKESELALIHKIMWGNEQAAARASAPPEGAGGKGGSKVAPLPAGYGDAEAPAKLGVRLLTPLPPTSTRPRPAKHASGARQPLSSQRLIPLYP